MDLQQPPLPSAPAAVDPANNVFTAPVSDASPSLPAPQTIAEILW